MIYTVTLNPAIDYRVYAEDFIKEGATVKGVQGASSIGGKGINVSIVLKRLGIPSVASGIAAGLSGKMLGAGLFEEGIENRFVEASKGETRINVKILSGKGGNEKTTEINGAGPVADDNEIDGVIRSLGDINGNDTVVLSGSLPSGVKKDVYRRIISEAVLPKGARFAVDICGEALIETLCLRPFLIKPNLSELAEIAGRTFENEEEIKAAGKELVEKGACNVIVSMGGQGAMLLSDKGDYFRSRVCSEPAKDPVGAGDSMVAGFIAGLERGMSIGEAFEFASKVSDYTARCFGFPKEYPF